MIVTSGSWQLGPVPPPTMHGGGSVACVGWEPPVEDISLLLSAVLMLAEFGHVPAGVFT